MSDQEAVDNLVNNIPAEDIHVNEDNNTLTIGNDETGRVSGIPINTPEEDASEAERPGWLPEKFKNPEGLVKSYEEAEKKMGEYRNRLGAFTGSPEEYDFSDIEGIEFDKESTEHKNALEMFKTNHISQEFATQLMTMYRDELVGQQKSHDDDLKELGPNYKETVVNLNNWAANNLSDKSAAMVGDLLEHPNVDVMQLLSEMKGNHVGAASTTPPDSEYAASENKNSFKELMKYYTNNLYSGENFSKNHEKAADFEKKIAEAMGQQ
ncbi:MAG: hypothetical protein ACTSP4_00540 [Candidatus Hodarchaeales archaeon]